MCYCKVIGFVFPLLGGVSKVLRAGDHTRGLVTAARVSIRLGPRLALFFGSRHHLLHGPSFDTLFMVFSGAINR